MIDRDQVNTCYKFDIKDKKMEIIPPIPYPKSAFGITFINQYIYVIGGSMGAGASSPTTERYNTIEKKWE